MGDHTEAMAAARDLLAWGRDRDRAALERALRAAEGPARAVARAMLDDPAAVEDATQECLLQLMRSAPRYDPRRSFHRWVGHLARTACLRWRRSEGRRRKHERSAPPPDQDAGADPEDLAAVRAAVRELPQAMRGAVELHYFSGLSQRAAAEVLGCSEGAIAVRLHRARQRLTTLLRRRGVRAAPSVLVAALAPLAASAAEQTAAAGASASVAALAGHAPATTLPLTTVQQGLFAMSQYPLVSAAAGLVLAAGIGFTAATAGEAPPPEPAPPVVEEVPAPAGEPAPDDGLFAGERAAVLRGVDRDAPFWLAADVATLRQRALAVPPFSLLGDERAAPVAAMLRQRAADSERGATMLQVLDRLGAVGITLEGKAGAAGGGSALVVELGAALEQVRAALGGADGEALADFTVRGSVNGDEVHAWKDSLLAIGEADYLARLLAGEPAAAPAVPAQAGADFGPLVAAFAELIPPEYDDRLRMVSLHLGPDWRRTRPRQDIAVEVDERGWRGTVALTGSIPTDPLDLVASAASDNGLAELGTVIARTRPFDPRFRFALEGAFLVVELGTELDPAVLDRPGRKPLEEPLQGVLAALSGDARLAVTPGAPLPRSTLVLGLRDDHALDLAPLMALLGRRASSIGEDAWQIANPGAPTFVRVHADRVVVTTDPDPTAGTRAADPTVVVPERELHARLDLPALWTALRGYVPMLAAGGRNRDLVQALTTLGPALIEHLPVWELDFRSTDDGFEATETGLPLGALLCAAGGGVIVERIAPASSREQVADAIAICDAVAAHPEAIALLRRIDAALEHGQDGLIDRRATLAAAGVTPAEVRAAIPALAEWDGGDPIGHLHSTADGHVHLAGFDSHTFDRHVERSHGRGPHARDIAWTIPVAEGVIAHCFPGGGVDLLLEPREYDHVAPPPTTADDF